MAEQQLSCPWCHEVKALRRSHLRTIDLPVLLIRRRPYRCLICNHRFYSNLHYAHSTKPTASHVQH